MRILAAVVTYNREKLLERCIDHLKKQTRPPDDIVVINNGSTDGTLAMLKRKNRQHPFYWASFIQSGEWANLAGQR